MLGVDLARALGVRAGDKVALIAPQGMVTPAGVMPRLKQFTVVGIFEAGIDRFRLGLALIHIEDAQTLYRLGDRGERRAPQARRSVRGAHGRRASCVDKLPRDVYASDWTRSHANFFRAVQIEKRMMFIILTLIVAVAAFNIVSTLVMAVTDKQADIAILRTLGAAPGSIMQIFMVQGVVIGVIGTLLGVVGGVITRAQHRRRSCRRSSTRFSVKFLSKDVYLISELPSDLQCGDVIADRR